VPASEGTQIVLTADRTLMAGYRLLFDGMLAASQTTTAPPWLIGWLIMPWAKPRNGRAAVAPLGLRRIEAALLRGGFSESEVTVVDELALAQAIGPATRIIGISAGEPAGMGMNSSTMTGVAGGRIYPEAMFRRLIQQVRRQLRSHDISAKIVLGGPGAWQLAEIPDKRKDLGIDHVVVGYAEDEVANVFRSLLRGEALPEVIAGQWEPLSTIPPIRHASTMGVVEISRGCGLNCSYCTIARVPMVHLPPQTIVSDVQTNVAAGLSSIAVLSEDFFRYGADGLRVNPQALISLLREIRRIQGLRLIQIDHANVISIAQFSDAELKEVHDLLVGDTGCRHLWVNVGVETASGQLLKDIGAAGKMNRCPPEQWGDLCAQQLRRLCQAGFLPMASLLIGTPQETDDDLRQTLTWVQSLSDLPITIFPVLHAPINHAAPPDPRSLRPLYWKLIKACYRLNFRWIPRMYWDNQSAAGVGLLKRATLQVLGLGQIMQWKSLFAWHSWRARP
jgi:radical SAM superfamily enzyme YgiQ (UPF0313 family)